MGMIVTAVVSVTVIGAICAVVISAASKIMAVKVDERIAVILDCLPGVNCGACGYPGCSGYAAALISGKNTKNNLCSPGGTAVLKKISAILGIEAGNVPLKYAVVCCRGGYDKHQKKMDYRGIQSCAAAKQLFGGEGTCAFGCLGYGDCKAVCPSNAICVENSLAHINKKFCTGCGLCVKACPNKLISVEHSGITVSVLCSNIEKGAIVRKKCSSGCIGCGKCVRECPIDAIIIEDNLARIDYDKCSPDQCLSDHSMSDPEHWSGGRCAEICVTKCIQPAHRPEVL